MARVDVVVPVYRGLELTRACLESVLQHGGDVLDRLILVDDCGPDAGMREMLRGYRDRHEHVRLLENEQNRGFISSANRGLALRRTHALVLNNDTRVTAGWLDELHDALEESPRLAALSPLSNNAGACSVPDFGRPTEASVLEGKALRLDGLPRWTEMPTAHGFCLLMRSDALDAIGLFDPAFGRGYHEENDWCQRARRHGYAVGRANRALVFHLGEASFGTQTRSQLDLANGRRLVARYPRYLEENRAFEAGPHARLAATAVRACLGRLVVEVGLPGESGRALVSALGQGARVEMAPATDSPDVRLLELASIAPPRAGLIVSVLGAELRGIDASQFRSWISASQRVLVPTETVSAEVARHVSLPGLRLEVAPRDAGGLRALIEEVALRPSLGALEAQQALGAS